MKKNILLKIFSICLVIVIYMAVMFVLGLSAKNGRHTQELLPEISDSPVYVECEQGQSLELQIEPTKDFTISGLQVLIVNLSDESRGTFQVTIRDDLGNLLTTQSTPIESINPGEWFVSSAEIDLHAGEKYHVAFLADGSKPYFMKVTKDVNKFPYKGTVIKDGIALDSQISVGVNIVTPIEIKFADIFYYSEFFATLGLVIIITLIIFGRKRIVNVLNRIPVKNIINKYGNDSFLALLFISLCVNIISKAYIKGVYISADSTGYLREAINLTKGYGFNYDGIAGYQSWFANWPIIYPLMIAGVMLVTGTNAYLASKILTMISVGFIILVLRFFFKKDACFYALTLTNIGFMSLTCYTWSEIPFIFFLICFSILLYKILEKKEPTKKMYLLLSLSGISCFLTRYFGIFIWFVVCVYLFCLLWEYRKSRDILILRKFKVLTVTSFISGMVCIAYLIMNKIMNGKPSGVSRGIWWDDYEILTNDLIESLLKEFFNVFSIQIPQVIEEIPYNMKVWVLLILLLGIIIFIYQCCHHFTWQSVMISMGIIYYLIFIAIRYRSSMDTFYFRFFEPASFLICLGIMGLLLPMIKDKTAFHYFSFAVGGILTITLVTIFQVGGMNPSNTYYASISSDWDNAYKEIPEKSVIIFNDIDFRASFYRPDVVDGTITPQDTFEELKNNYYGSDYLCIRTDFVKTMLKSNEYDTSVEERLKKALDEINADNKYVIISLR